MNEKVTYSIGICEKDRPPLIGYCFHQESDNPQIILVEYERYKRIFNPKTTTIMLGRTKKTLEDLSLEELKAAIR